MPDLARSLDACDTVVADIAAAWSPQAPDGVRRAYVPRIGFSGDHKNSLLAGRQVYAFPAPWRSPEAASRGELLHEYTVVVVVAERYTVDGQVPQGPVPDEWVDARVLFVEQQFNRLKDPTRVLTGARVQLYRHPEVEATLDEVYDLADLLEHKAFWSQFTITFLEIVGTAGD